MRYEPTIQNRSKALILTATLVAGLLGGAQPVSAGWAGPTAPVLPGAGGPLIQHSPAIALNSTTGTYLAV